MRKRQFTWEMRVQTKVASLGDFDSEASSVIPDYSSKLFREGCVRLKAA
jgi:hypothetical protein